MKVFCGIDWAERHHDVALVDETGALIAKKRIGDTAEGFAALLELLASAGDSSEQSIPVAIETPRGLLVASLRATGRPIYAINPMAVARYRERSSQSRKKSDHGDAMVLANILRTDAHAHRTLPADTDLVRAIGVLARAQQDATWRRTRASNELRSLLREYFPGFLAAFAHRTGFLMAPEARAILALAPTPTAAIKASKARLAAALRRAGRQRGIETLAAELHAVFRLPQMRQPVGVEEAMGTAALALLATLNAECANADQLAQAAAAAFTEHPDHEIITSFPGLGDLTGARVLGELGDDRQRFADARALKAYAGAAPVTRASGRSISIKHRKIKNDRLAQVGFVWAFIAASQPGGGREHYLRRRTGGERHASALRNLFNRYLGCLHHCLTTRQTYDETKAFAARQSSPAPANA